MRSVNQSPKQCCGRREHRASTVTRCSGSFPWGSLCFCSHSGCRCQCFTDPNIEVPFPIVTDRWASDNSTLHAEVESLCQRILGMPLVQGQLLEDKNDTKPIPMGSEDAREHAHSSDGDQEGNHKKLLRKVVAGCILTGTLLCCVVIVWAMMSGGSGETNDLAELDKEEAVISPE